jgi:hypothetical protein
VYRKCPPATVFRSDLVIVAQWLHRRLNALVALPCVCSAWSVSRCLSNCIISRQQQETAICRNAPKPVLEDTWHILNTPAFKRVKLSRKYEKKQFCCGHEILTEGVFVTQLWESQFGESCGSEKLLFRERYDSSCPSCPVLCVRCSSVEAEPRFYLHDIPAAWLHCIAVAEYEVLANIAKIVGKAAAARRFVSCLEVTKLRNQDSTATLQVQCTQPSMQESGWRQQFDLRCMRLANTLSRPCPGWERSVYRVLRPDIRTASERLQVRCQAGPRTFCKKAIDLCKTVTWRQLLNCGPEIAFQWRHASSPSLTTVKCLLKKTSYV